MGIKDLLAKLDAAYQRLPFPVRATLSVSRWYGGIKGLPAMMAAIASLVWGGAVIAVFGSLPVATQVLWGAAGMLGLVTGAGQVGAWIRAKSGNVTLMTDIQFLRHVRSTSNDAARAIIRRGAPPDVFSLTPEIQGHIDRRHEVAKLEDKTTYFIDIHPKVMVSFKEAIRRRLLTYEEVKAVLDVEDKMDMPEELAKRLALVVNRLQSRTNYVGD